MFKKISIGVDPGAQGAMCAIIDYEDGRMETLVFRFKKMTEADMADEFSKFRNMSGKVNIYGVVEKVHSMPQQGVASTFKFGKSYGFVLGLMYANKIPFDDDTPRTWMKTYGMTKGKNESSTEWKNRLKAKAQQIFPEAKITNDMADAMLIANYVRKFKDK